MLLSNIKPNPNNPRVIKDEKYKKLVNSVKDFPKMMAARPIVCVTDTDKKLYPLGGNMRLRALKDLGYKEIPDNWVKIVDDYTEDERKEFVIKDNVAFGEWDFDALANDWELHELENWGIDVPQVNNSELPNNFDYSDKNKEIDVDSIDGTMCLKLNYNETDYWAVKNALLKIAATPEAAIFQLLNLE